MELREPIIFEHEEKKKYTFFYVLMVICLVTVVAWQIKYWIQHHRAIAGLPIGALTLYVMFSSHGETRRHRITLDRKALTVDQETEGKKPRETVFRWVELRHVKRNVVWTGVAAGTEIRGSKKRIQFPEGVVKKDLVVLLGSLAHDIGFKMIGFGEAELRFDESDLQVPENVRVQEFMERNGLRYPS